MGLYATTTAISELAPFYLRGNTATSDTAGSPQFSRHIDRAEADVNAACATHYDLPFTTTGIPPYVRRIAEDRACLYAFRGAYVQEGNLRQESLADYKWTDNALDGIRKGEVRLAYTDGSLYPSRSSGQFLSSTEGYTPIFGLDTATAWKRDPDEVDAQSEARD